MLLRWVAGQLGRGSCRTFTDALHFLSTCPPGNDPLDFVFGDLANEFTAAEIRVLCALTYFTLPASVKHITAITNPLTEEERDVSEFEFDDGDDDFDVEFEGQAEAPQQSLSDVEAETALRSLANRSLVVPDQEEKQYALVPMVGEFLRKHRPEVVRETGNRLEKRAYALIVENGFQKHDRFPVLDAAWPIVAPALALFLAGPNPRLQIVCDAFNRFLDYTGRWDEMLSLSQQAEGRAVAAGDHDEAAWRAQQVGWVHSLRQEADAVLTCAERAAVHWQAAKAGSRERAAVIRLRGLGHRLKEDYSAAISAYREALDIFRGLSAESEDVAVILSALASAEKNSGDLDAAERDFREALRVGSALGYAEGVANNMGNLAALALDRKDWSAAESLAREALTLAEQLGRQELIAADCGYLANALVHQGKAGQALPHARRAVEIYMNLKSPHLEWARQTLAECESAASPQTG